MKIQVEECCLLIIDIQEKLVPLIHNSDLIVQSTLSLIDIKQP